jgi:hypothetical protein
MTPTKAIKEKCTDCLGLNQYNEEAVRDCQGNTCLSGPCPLFPYRLGKRVPVKVIRAFCLECMNGHQSLVTDCPSKSCPLYQYRMGRNPSRTGIGNHNAKLPLEFRNTERESTINSGSVTL